MGETYPGQARLEKQKTEEEAKIKEEVGSSRVISTCKRRSKIPRASTHTHTHTWKTKHIARPIWRSDRHSKKQRSKRRLAMQGVERRLFSGALTFLHTL